MTPIALLKDWIESCQPKSLIHLGRTAPPSLEEDASSLHPVFIRSANDLDFSQSIPDAVIVSDYLESCSQPEGEELLARLRNYLIPNVLIFIDHDAAERWTLGTFLALGFRHLDCFENQGQTVDCYAYNLATYNPRRAWNNSDHWANPELFGKYWW